MPDQGQSGSALVLTADQRVDEADKLSDGPFAGLKHLHAALSGRTKDRVPPSLMPEWQSVPSEEYYEDDSDLGVPSQRQEKVMEQKSDEAVAASADEEVSEFDPDGVVASFMAERSTDVIREEEAAPTPQFRHRGWSYDLMSAAGWQKGPNSPEGPLLDYRQVEKDLAEKEAMKGRADQPKSGEITRLNPVKSNRARKPVQEPAEQESLDIDRDMLREVVAEVLREELAGELGERVTRNVRKLVRREIVRALQSED